MTIDQFRDEILGDKAKTVSEEQIQAFYRASTGLFGLLFNKWKKERFEKGGSIKI